MPWGGGVVILHKEIGLFRHEEGRGGGRRREEKERGGEGGGGGQAIQTICSCLK